MIIYLIMILTSITIMFIAEKMKNKYLKCFLYILSIVPFFVVSAIRYDVGTDYTRTYVNMFNYLLKTNTTRAEEGFAFLIKTCQKISTSPNILFVVTSFINVFLIGIVIIKKSKNKILSLLIWFLGGFFFESLNILRQYIAVSLILCGYTFFIKDMKFFINYIIYILFVLLAAQFHESSLVAIVLIFCKKINIINIKFIIPLAIAIIIFKDKMWEILDYSLKDWKYHWYLTNEFAKGELSILNIGINLIYYIVLSYIYYREKKKDNITKEHIFLLNCQGIAFICTILATCHMLFFRIAVYFEIFQIISLPMFLSILSDNKIESTSNKLIKINFINKIFSANIMKKLITCGFLVMLIGAIYYTNIKNNDNGVRPYVTIFNEDIKFK